MKILVTGSDGLVGSQVTRELERAGHEVEAYDLASGLDVLDPESLGVAVAGCDGVIHAAALLGTADEPEEDVLSVNVAGTWNALMAAARAGVPRFVNLSSADVLGVFKGERTPDYLPLDDAHPCEPTTPYGVSKVLAEEMCRWVAALHGMCVISLRPPGVWSRKTYRYIEKARAMRPEFEWDPYWEYGAFIDVRDLASACLHALTCEAEGDHAVLVAADDITTSGRGARELTELLHPQVEWRGGPVFDEDPYRSLIDTGRAKALLGWTPRYTWRDRSGLATSGG